MVRSRRCLLLSCAFVLAGMATSSQAYAGSTVNIGPGMLTPTQLNVTGDAGVNTVGISRSGDVVTVVDSSGATSNDMQGDCTQSPPPNTVTCNVPPGSGLGIQVLAGDNNDSITLDSGMSYLGAFLLGEAGNDTFVGADGFAHLLPRPRRRPDHDRRRWEPTP